MSDQEEKIQQFKSLTSTPDSVARSILERNGFDLQNAINDFYSGGTQRSNESTPTSQVPQANKTSQSKSKFKSFQELINGDEEEDDQQNFFAGGARGSGLQVENPDAQNLVQDLLRKAETGGGHPERTNDNDSEPTLPKFTGTGYKLGDSTNPSRTVENLSSTPKRLEKAIREITFWKDGFQVGDGRLYRYDDPANSAYLTELNSGRAPLALLDVEYGQDVDVNVVKKLDEEYVPPKRKIEGFHGHGKRLGSPVSPDLETPPPVIDSATEEKAAEQEPTVKEEVQEGDASVQIRLVDGRRVVRRVNSSDSVQQLYDYVASETSGSRQFVLTLSFPVKPITDKEQSIKDAGLANSVIVQRWA